MNRIPKAKKCCYCKKTFQPDRTFQKFCGPQCSYKGVIEKKQKDRAKANRKAKQEFNENDRGWLIKKTKTTFNKYIRTRDKGKPCISCGKPDDGSHQRHASHYRPAGVNSALMFDESNVYASCKQCNKDKSGNLTEYRVALVELLGEEKVTELDNNHEIKRWTIDELREICAMYKANIKALVNNAATPSF